ncbi:hypothetical protein OAJ73_03595, partial [Gammaproteobacteria bacterium]|nr:hypothetical protein [Gammaproteobacteria bacterium]
SLSPRMTVGDIIGEGILVHEPDLSFTDRKSKILESLMQVEMEEDAFSKFPHEFSGGQTKNCYSKSNHIKT